MNKETQNTVKLELIRRLTMHGSVVSGSLNHTIQRIVLSDLNDYGDVEKINNCVEEMVFEDGIKAVSFLSWFNARCITTILNG